MAVNTQLCLSASEDFDFHLTAQHTGVSGRRGGPGCGERVGLGAGEGVPGVGRGRVGERRQGATLQSLA